MNDFVERHFDVHPHDLPIGREPDQQLLERFVVVSLTTYRPDMVIASWSQVLDDPDKGIAIVLLSH
ncbi:hypothetical protein [Nocardia sp. NPDC050710]|uniref:hypothetical protein n=1 Tax=Nocardia sp. NPDC050710 TaxID=3157220 RepID=UPI0033E28E53